MLRGKTCFRLYSRAAVCSFFPNIVYEVRRADPKVSFLIQVEILMFHKKPIKCQVIVGHTWRPGFYAYKDLLSSQARNADQPLLHYGFVNDTILINTLKYVNL